MMSEKHQQLHDEFQDDDHHDEQTEMKDLLPVEDPKVAENTSDFFARWENSDYEVHFGKWYKEGWSIFKEEWTFFVLCFLLEIVCWFVPYFNGWLAAIPQIASSVYGLHVIRHKAGGPKLYSNSTFITGVYFWLPLVAQWICWVFAVGIGFLLLILPGIWLWISSLFSGALLIEYWDEKITFYDTFKWSVKRIWKHFWWIFLFEIVTFLFALSGLLLLGVGIFVTLPVAKLSVLVAFKEIYGLNPDRKEDHTLYYLCGKKEM